MVRIQFHTDNAAFRDTFTDNALDLHAVAECVHTVADSISNHISKGVVRDLNGNVVGNFTVTNR